MLLLQVQGCRGDLVLCENHMSSWLDIHQVDGLISEDKLEQKRIQQSVLIISKSTIIHGAHYVLSLAS